MAQVDSIEIYRFDDLMVLWWPNSGVVQGGINIFLNGEPVARPLVGVGLPDQGGHLLAAHAPRLPHLHGLQVEIRDGGDSVLVSGTTDEAEPFDARQLANWSLPARIRIEKALLGHLPKTLPQIKSGTLLKVADALADPRAILFRLADGVLYARMPWAPVSEPACLDVTVKSLFSARSGDFEESAKALVDGGWLHVFLRNVPADLTGDPVWIVDAGKIRIASLKVSGVTELPAGRSAGSAIDALCADYNGNQTVLRAFAEAVRKPPRRRAGELKDDERLVGRVEALVNRQVKGWAFDRQRPHMPVTVQAWIDDQLLGSVEANLPRPEQSAGGYGHCGFLLPLDAEWLAGDRYELHLRCAETGLELPGSPLALGRSCFDVEMHLDDAGCLSGWLRERCSAPGPARLRVFLDGSLCDEVTSGISRIGGLFDDGRQLFNVPLPERAFDTAIHRVEAEIVDAAGALVQLDGSVRFQAVYRGHVEAAGPGRVTGWIVNTIAPNRPVTLDVLVNGQTAATTRADLSRIGIGEGEADGRCGFDCTLPLPGIHVGSSRLELRIAGTETAVLGPVLLHTPYDIAVRSLTTLAEILNDPEALQKISGGLAFDQDVASWARTQIIAKVLGELRRGKGMPAKLNLEVTPLIALAERQTADPVIDVIIPIYMGREETLRCLASVMMARCRTPMEIIAINDASPDPEYCRELRNFAAARGVTLLENPRNLGFVGTVNRGMRLHPDRDVVLLNSDTVVADGWLDRLRQGAYSAANIGTATPLSNNAAICSFPVFCAENPIPYGLTTAALDELFARENPGRVIDLPTAVGFCMFIKRGALNEAGYFDEAQWGKGYGEENDFCLRAASLGWRHVAACDVFVEHAGGVSFSGDKQGLMARNGERLNTLYPDYSATVQRFIAQDPLADVRNGVSRSLLKSHSSQYLLFVTHGLGGGVKTASDRLSDGLRREGVEVLELQAPEADCYRLSCRGLPYQLTYRGTGGFERLLQDLKELDIWHIHFHQTMGFTRRILDFPNVLKVPYDFTAHDYQPVCPRIDMIDESGHFCGDSQYDADNCSRCIRYNGCHEQLTARYAEFGGNVAAWRDLHGIFLKGARRIFMPSQDVANRYRRHFPLENTRVLPHPEPQFELRRRQAPKPHAIAVIGAIGPHKGYDTLLQCVRGAVKEGLPLHFSIIGFTADDEQLRAYENVSITGEYRLVDLPGLIEASGASTALFLSRAPETYCLSLTEAWRHGLFPVATDIGALGERIRDAGFGRLIPAEASGREVNRVLMEVCASPPTPADQAIVLGGEPDSLLRDYYGLDGPPSVVQSPIPAKAGAAAIGRGRGGKRPVRPSNQIQAS